MKWKQKQATSLSQNLIEEFQLSPLQAKLFSLRGINTKEKLDYWFNADETSLADPYLMHDMEKAIERINHAIDAGEKITVYGDYDADGITATSIMVETLSILGADVHYFIPDRFKDGYGPNLDRYKEIVADGTKLIITVDNGVTGIEEVAYAKENGVDTIVTDHHTFQAEKPDAYAIVHCNYPGQNYPFDDYCGAGVAYTIARALMDDPMTDMLELAMIGTIGDMVKVSGEGHVIVKRGLEMLNQTERPGLRALIKLANLNLGKITATDIGFNIAPRLNAVGRLANAELAVELLLTDNEEQAQEIAQKIEDLNNKRKELSNEVFQKCVTQVTQNGWQNNSTLVIYDADFHEGVLGLVANKIVEKFNKPTIVLTKNNAGEIKGSGRSISGYNLFNALEPLKGKLLTKFGGHDFACGLSLEEKNIQKLRDTFENNYQGVQELEVKEYDLELPMDDLGPEIIAEIAQVGPFGTNNSEPVFKISEPTITHFFKMGKEKNHVKFTAEKDHSKLQVVGFNKAYINSDLLPFVKNLYITLSLNSWQKRISLQGMIEGIEFGAPKLAVPTQIVDLRDQQYIMGFADKYLLFDKNLESLVRNNLGIPTEKISLVSDYHQTGEILVLLDTPRNKQELDQAFENSYQQMYLRFLLDRLPIENLPNKSDFGKTLKYIYAHPNLRPEDYRTVAPFLGLDYQSVLFILRVFFELKFVSYQNGTIIGEKNPQNHPLTDSKYYSAIASQLNFVNSLRNLPSNQLIEYAKKFGK